MRRAVFALTTASVIILLMLTIAQVTVVEANPWTFRPGLYVRSPGPGLYLDPNVNIYFEYIFENNLTQIDSFSFSLDKNALSTLPFRISKSDYFVNGHMYTVSKTLENLADGIHTLAVYAYFSDGTVESILDTIITVDTTLNPIIISPLNQTTYNATQVPLIYTTISKVLWSYYSLDSINASDLKNFNGNITLPSLSEGQHELDVAVTTNISRTNPTYQQPHQTIDTIIFYIDTVAPKITNLSVDSTDTSDLLLNFTVDENTSWVGYSLDNQANITINGNAVLRDLSNGVHNVTVYAKDSAGNIGVSETISFTVGLFPLIVIVALIVTATIVSGGLLVYLKRRKVS